MMKVLFAFLTLIFSLPLFGRNGQVADGDSLTTAELFTPIEFFGGKKLYRFEYKGAVNTLEHFDMREPVSFLGFGWNGSFIINRAYQYAGHMALLFIVPQKIQIPGTGTGRLTGFTYSMSLAGFDIFPKQNDFDIVLSTGFNTGKVRIRGIESAKQRNPFFAPMAATYTKFTFGHLSLGINIQYEYDISNTKWKRVWFAEHVKTDLGRFNHSGLSTFICLGYTP